MNADRITEIAMAAAALWLAVLLWPAGAGGPAASGLAEARARQLTGVAMERFGARLAQVRRLVDGSGDADRELSDLLEGYPGRHEAWSLAGRYHEAAGRSAPSLMAYATAVRLQPDYLDDRSGLYLGGRIGKLVDTEMERLSALKRKGSLQPADKAEIKAAYFLKRRLAGGCE